MEFVRFVGRDSAGADGPPTALIEEPPMSDRNVDAVHDTADLYRHFDRTEAARFLYACVRRTSTASSRGRSPTCGGALVRIMETVEKPDRIAEDPVMLIRRHGGTLSASRRANEFRALDDSKVERPGQIVRKAVEGFETAGEGHQRQQGARTCGSW